MGNHSTSPPSGRYLYLSTIFVSCSVIFFLPCYLTNLFFLFYLLSTFWRLPVFFFRIHLFVFFSSTVSSLSEMVEWKMDRKNKRKGTRKVKRVKIIPTWPAHAQIKIQPWNRKITESNKLVTQIYRKFNCTRTRNKWRLLWLNLKMKDERMKQRWKENYNKRIEIEWKETYNILYYLFISVYFILIYSYCYLYLSCFYSW